MAATAPPSVERRRVPPLGAFVEGWRRVLAAPAVVAGTVAAIWISSRLVMAVLPVQAPLMFDRGPIAAARWMLTLQWELRRLTSVIAPDLSVFLTVGPLPGPVLAAIGMQSGVWLFLSGGLLDRFARARPIRTAAFFAASGVYFFKFLRLAAIIGVVGWALLRLQLAFAESLTARLIVLVAVAALGIITDFAKVRSVVEERHSMIGALAASIRFLRGRPGRALGLTLVNGLTMLAIVRILFQIDNTPAPAWLSGALSIAWIVLGTAARLAFLASEVVFFQGELAHAGYTAAPPYVWPDSPAVEAMDNLVKGQRVKG